MNFLKKYAFIILGVAIGSIAGYLYFFFVGCKTGTCPITASPINSVLYGAMMGGMAVNLFEKEKKKD